MPFDQFFAPIQTGLMTWFHTGTALARHMAQHEGGTILGITAMLVASRFTASAVSVWLAQQWSITSGSWPLRMAQLGSGCVGFVCLDRLTCPGCERPGNSMGTRRSDL